MRKSADQAISKLQQKLHHLRTHGFVAGLKSGTEIEDMGVEEIQLLKTICADLPLTIKIGGPEARRDIRECLEIKVDTILAPMIETGYALANFVAAAKELASGKLPKLAMNLETSTAVQNLDTMIRSSAFDALSSVTIGRGDLSASMNLAVDDPEVIAMTSSSLRKIHNAGIETSVGGGWKVESIEGVLPMLPSTTINTRHMVLQNSPGFAANPRFHLANALAFEIELYEFFEIQFPARKKFYRHRQNVLASRLGQIQRQGNRSA